MLCLELASVITRHEDLFSYYFSYQYSSHCCLPAQVVMLGLPLPLEARAQGCICTLERHNLLVLTFTLRFSVGFLGCCHFVRLALLAFRCAPSRSPSLFFMLASKIKPMSLINYPSASLWLYLFAQKSFITGCYSVGRSGPRPLHPSRIYAPYVPHFIDVNAGGYLFV